MSSRLASIVLVTTLIAQAPSHAAGPRIAPVPENQRSAEQKALAERFASSTIPNAVATYLNHPLLAEHILPFEHYVSSDSGLPPRDRSLLILRTAWLTRSDYLWAHRVGAARQAGVTTDELRRIAEGPGANRWDAFDAVLLRAADELHVDSFVSDATWQALSERYNTNQLVDLVDTVGTLTMHAGAFNSLGLEIEPGLPGTASDRNSRMQWRQRERTCACWGESPAFHRSSPGTGRPSSASDSIPTEPVSAQRTSSSRSCAILLRIACAVPSTSTFSIPRRCPSGSGKRC